MISFDTLWDARSSVSSEHEALLLFYVFDPRETVLSPASRARSQSFHLQAQLLPLGMETASEDVVARCSTRESLGCPRRDKGFDNKGNFAGRNVPSWRVEGFAMKARPSSPPGSLCLEVETSSWESLAELVNYFCSSHVALIRRGACFDLTIARFSQLNRQKLRQVLCVDA